jgi:ADP-heptose:LPS heptosyltransferase
MRILMVSTTAIGDTVMATPFIRAVRKKYPQAQLTFFAHHRRMGVLEGNPHINNFLIYYGKGKKLWMTLWGLHRGNFDLVIVLHANDPDVVPLVRWTGAAQRVGWGESKWAHLFTHTIRRTHPPEHFLIHKKRLLESVGIPVEDLHTEIFLDLKDEKFFSESLQPWLNKYSKNHGYVVMHAFGTNVRKWWPLENFLQVAERTFEKHQLPTVFVGDDNVLDIIDRHPSFNSTRQFTARGANLRESAFIMKKAKAMLTTDSGPMHLAFAVGCPTLSLFGPTQPSIHGPCFDQHRHQVIHRNPLVALTVEEVLESWNKTLNPS